MCKVSVQLCFVPCEDSESVIHDSRNAFLAHQERRKVEEGVPRSLERHSSVPGKSAKVDFFVFQKLRQLVLPRASARKDSTDRGSAVRSIVRGLCSRFSLRGVLQSTGWSTRWDIAGMSWSPRLVPSISGTRQIVFSYQPKENHHLNQILET